jgi:hypothetical protein
MPRNEEERKEECVDSVARSLREQRDLHGYLPENKIERKRNGEGRDRGMLRARQGG